MKLTLIKTVLSDGSPVWDLHIRQDGHGVCLPMTATDEIAAINAADNVLTAIAAATGESRRTLYPNW